MLQLNTAEDITNNTVGVVRNPENIEAPFQDALIKVSKENKIKMVLTTSIPVFLKMDATKPF